MVPGPHRQPVLGRPLPVQRVPGLQDARPAVDLEGGVTGGSGRREGVGEEQKVGQLSVVTFVLIRRRDLVKMYGNMCFISCKAMSQKQE